MEESFLVILADLLRVTSLCIDRFYCHTFYSNKTEK